MPTDSYLFLNGHRFHYLVQGGGSGRPMVLLHGLASNARIWNLVAPRLAEHFRVFALDQRGHGLSDPIEGDYDPAMPVRDLHAFVEALHLERPVLVGHSWGAYTVLDYAVKRPAGPAGIVLVDGAVGEMSAQPGATWEQAKRFLTPPELDGMPREEFLSRLRDWLGDLYSDAVAEIVLANFAVSEDDTIRRRLPIPQHMQIARAIYHARPSELLSRLRCPALLCLAVPPPPVSERDALHLTLKRLGATQAEQANPRVRTVWFEATIHDIPLHRPEALAEAILDFTRDSNL